MTSLRRWWSEERWLVASMLALIAVYGVFAMQGALPLLSPDETAVFALAKSVWTEGRLGLEEARAQTFLWLHPRSFTTQDGWLLPVGFPLWPFLLGLVGWVGSGALILWLQVLVSASSIIPLSRIAERCWSWSKRWSIAWAGVILLFPVAVLYGARSGFTLMPQLAFVAWSCWLLLSGPEKRGRAVGVGVLIAGAIGMRPTEAVWIIPFVLFCWHTARSAWKGYGAWLVLGGVLGASSVLGVHWWVYGAPWMIGYLLPASSVMVRAPSPTVVSVASWRRLFPYGFSLSRLHQNGVAAWHLGFWPWLIVWGGAASCWALVRRVERSRQTLVLFALLCWTTVWLAFYYGQGQYADHIGGQGMHLGNSFLRYLAPALLGWMAWTGWMLRSWARTLSARVLVALVFCVSMIAGTVWAYMDAEDGLMRGRREREHYAEVRAQMRSLSDERAIWISDRSDKMLFPERQSVSPLPPRAEIRRFLSAQDGAVFLYARPPRQQDRDLWSQEGLELIERAHFERENIYEVRLRAGFAEAGVNQAH